MEQGFQASSDSTHFYDDLAEDYHLLFADWRMSLRQQGEILDRLVARHQGPGPQRILDAACGIGTQAIGLAMRGHAVHATDQSAAAVRRARREAASQGATLTFDVVDMRNVARQVSASFHVVLACDNALPHLLSLDDLRRAVQAMHGALVGGGLFLASIRDYDLLLEQRPSGDPPRMFSRPDGRQIAFQVWAWDAATPNYRLHQFIMRERGGSWETREYTSEYRALRRAELGAILSELGFDDIRWHMPEESGYYQPIVTARR